MLLRRYHTGAAVEKAAAPVLKEAEIPVEKEPEAEPVEKKTTKRKKK